MNQKLVNLFVLCVLGFAACFASQKYGPIKTENLLSSPPPPPGWVPPPQQQQLSPQITPIIPQQNKSTSPG